MKRKINSARILRTTALLGCFLFTFFAAARAQVPPPPGTVIPRVCFEAKTETFPRTLTNSLHVGHVNTNPTPGFDQGVPLGYYRIVFDPGGATQETLVGFNRGNETTVYFGGILSQEYLYAHPAGQRVDVIKDGEAHFGYNNLSSTAVTISRGVPTQNYLTPGALVSAAQPVNFQPGVHENVSFMNVSSLFQFTWVLNGGQVNFLNNAEQGCGTITYQGRLSDSGAAANGQYDLEFKIFNAPAGGTLQTQTMIENVAVTNGIFTVRLDVGAALNNNYAAKYLEIGARHGAATDAFTTLTPRQPLTQVPNAINAINAINAERLNNVPANQYVLTTDPRLTIPANSTNFIQNSTVQQAASFNIGGSGTIGGNLTVSGTLNANYGQTVETVLGTGVLPVDASTTAYTLVPGLTQTIDVPANSSLLISTEAGIQSNGTAGSASVVDAAIFVDGTLLKASRITILNTPFPFSVNNWVLSSGQTPAAGSHRIEVRVRTGVVIGTVSANVSSGSDPLLRGQLTVAVIRK